MKRRALLTLTLVLAGCIYFPIPGDTDSEGSGGSGSGTDTGGGAVQWVAVGDGGTIVRSPDGASWTLSTSGVTVALNAVAHGDGRFVAVGQAGKILASTDGVDWNPASSPSSRDLFAVLRHGVRFVAVGGDYSVGAETLESTDGVTWTRPEYPAPKHLLHGLASDGATLVAIGSYQADLMTFGEFTWQDGVGWVERIDGAATGKTYSAVAHGAPNFVMIGPVSAATSGDGASWTNYPIFGVSSSAHGLAYGPAGWIAAGGAGQILGSFDGIQWTAQVSPFTSDLFAVASDGVKYVVVGGGGSIAASAGGGLWTAATSPTTAELRGVVRSQ